MRHRYEERSTLTTHSATPYHCVCNGTHLPSGCWCMARRGKPSITPGRFARVVARLLGGGRP